MDKIKIVKIKGGIGNQLFQYSFAKILELRSKETIRLDFSSCHGCKNKTCENRLILFNISLQEATENEMKRVCLCSHKNAPLGTIKYKISAFVEKVFNKNCCFEKTGRHFDINSIIHKDYFDGYWQSWEFPFGIRDTLIKEISLKSSLSEKSNEFIHKINGEQAVFVGVRRGDYVSNKKVAKQFGSFGNDYYTTAMSIISERVKNPIFYIFSNDIDWCKKNMDFHNFHVLFREKYDQTSDLEELIIMSCFKHAIIMNSTFHWWGAFLIKNPGKIVVAPNEWFADGTQIDIVPNEWIRLGRNGEKK